MGSPSGPHGTERGGSTPDPFVDRRRGSRWTVRPWLFHLALDFGLIWEFKRFGNKPSAALRCDERSKDPLARFAWTGPLFIVGDWRQDPSFTSPHSRLLLLSLLISALPISSPLISAPASARAARPDLRKTAPQHRHRPASRHHAGQYYLEHGARGKCGAMGSKRRAERARSDPFPTCCVRVRGCSARAVRAGRQ